MGATTICPFSIACEGDQYQLVGERPTEIRTMKRLGWRWENRQWVTERREAVDRLMWLVEGHPPEDLHEIPIALTWDEPRMPWEPERA